MDALAHNVCDLPCAAQPPGRLRPVVYPRGWPLPLLGCLRSYFLGHAIGITSSAAVRQAHARAQAMWNWSLDAQTRGNVAARVKPPNANPSTGIKPAILPYLTAPPMALTNMNCAPAYHIRIALVNRSVGGPMGSRAARASRRRRRSRGDLLLGGGITGDGSWRDAHTVPELDAAQHGCHELWGVDSAPSLLRGLDQLEGHRQAGRTRARAAGLLGSRLHGPER